MKCSAFHRSENPHSPLPTHRNKLKKLLGQHNGDVSASNGHNSSSGLDKFSADEEDEDDVQPAARKRSPRKKAAEAAPASPGRRKSSGTSPGRSPGRSGLRQRFAEEANKALGEKESLGRFTPTPRRSIHTYKVRSDHRGRGNK